MVKINQDLCIGCGICMEDCFVGAIDLETGKANIKKPCIQCGHCVALCPTEAISIPEYDMEDIEPYQQDTFAVKADNMLHAIKFRRSIRNYKPDKIEQEKAAHILDAGRYTATAKNRQGTRFIFVQEHLEEFKQLVWSTMPEVIQILKKEAPPYAMSFGDYYAKWQKNPQDDKLFFNTPAFLVIATDNQWDAGLAAANIENTAVAEGLGALYSGYLMRIIASAPKLTEWLGTEGDQVACCMLLGYPAVTYLRTAPRQKGDIVWK